MFSLDSSSVQFLPSLEFLIKLIGGLTAVVLFIVGFKRYSRDLRWKKNEFVANVIKEFYGNPRVMNALYMLDWGSRKIELFPTDPNYSKRFVIVTHAILQEALKSHRIRNKFNPEEVAIRDTFDEFLNQLEKFDHFVEAELVSCDEFKPYLIYWIRTIALDLNPNLREILHQYIEEYDYEGVQHFFQLFGYNIAPKEKIVSTTQPKNEFEEQTEPSIQ